VVGWVSNADSGIGTPDTGFARAAAGVVQVNGGTTATRGVLSSLPLIPAQITSNQNDYAPGLAEFLALSTDASRTLTGLAGYGVDGLYFEIWNVGSNPLVLANESASSAAANRFLTSTGSDVTLAAGEMALCRYSGGSVNRIRVWRVVSSSAGGGATTLDDLTDVTISGAASAQVLTYNGSAWVNGAVNLADSAAVTGDLPFANLAQITGPSLLGVSGTALADVAAITSSADGQVMRRAGSGIAFGSIDLANSTTVGSTRLALANLAQGSALSVLGVTGNATADNASITAGTDGHALRRSGTSVGFGTLAAGAFADNTVAPARLAFAADNRLAGRSAGSAGAGQEILIGPSLRWRSNQPSAGGTLTVLTDGATVTADCNTSNRFTWTIGGTGRTFALSNDADGDVILVYLKQDGTGSRTVTTWPTGIVWRGTTGPTTPPVLSTAAGTRDEVSIHRLGASDYVAYFAKGS
jgi:hypothetical protein